MDEISQASVAFSEKMRPEFSGYRYLIIDDNRYMVSLLKEILKSFGAVDIREFYDAASAISLMETIPFDMVLVDYLMEPMDGLDFLRIIRGTESGLNRRVPIILVSAHADRETVLAAQNAGANATVVKPVSPHQIYRHLLACMFKPLPFIISSTYVGPSRPVEADALLVAAWERGEQLPPDVIILPPQPLSPKMDERMH